MKINLRQMAVFLAAILVGSGAQAVAVPNYMGITLLPANTSHGGGAHGINDIGQVVGKWNPPNWTQNSSLLWNGTTSTDLDGLDGYAGFVYGINNAGQAVGSSWTGVDGSNHATLWNGTTATDLCPFVGTTSSCPFGGFYSYASDINDHGQIVGASGTSTSDREHATLWNGTTVIDLGVRGGPSGGGRYSSASAINNAGQIVGSSDGFYANNHHATLWNGADIIDLGTLLGIGGGTSYAFDINDAGLIVGSSDASSVDSHHATLWDGATLTDLGTLGGRRSRAYAINNDGLIVGDSTVVNDTETHATLWNGTTAIDLNSYLDESLKNSGWYLVSAKDINSAGTVVGHAFNQKTVRAAAFILSVSSVPEPQTYAMMLLGSCLVAGFARRRCQVPAGYKRAS